MATLISKDRTYQVRKSRHKMRCYGADKFWRSHLCTKDILPGDTYVAKVELGEIAGRERWIRDKRHYCEHCILQSVPAVSVGEEKAA
jgi:hypothetical protein